VSQTLIYALWGTLFGFLLSAPVGPVNILCMRRAIFGRARDGFVIGLGAAAGDAFYAALAAFGLNAIFKLIESHETILMVVGSVIMASFALRIWKDKPHLDREPLEGKVKRSMFGALAMTLTNPGVFVGFLGLYTLVGIGDLGAGPNRAHEDAAALTGGVFFGAALWWIVLAAGTKAFKDRFNDDLLIKINHISAGIIGFFAIFTLSSALYRLMAF